MIIKESFQDIENYLRSSDLYDKIVNEFGEDFYSNFSDREICDFIYLTILEDFDVKSVIDSVVVCKIVGEEVNVLDTDHSVINYNGYYYDFTAMIYNDSFDNLISSNNIPIVQPTIKTDAQVSEIVSTVKGYVMLGDNK